MYESSFPCTNAVAREGGGRGGGVHVKGGLLVRVLAVAQRSGEREGERQALGKRLARLFREPARDRGVIGRRAPEDLRSETPARLVAETAAALRQLQGDGRVVRRVADGSDVRVVLRRRAQERRPADVDLLDGLAKGDVLLRDGLLERIEIHDDEVDRPDAVRGRLGAVALLGPVEEDAAEELRVERLHAPAEDLGEAGEIRDTRDGETRGCEVSGRAARRDESEAQPGEGAGEFDEAAAVGDGEEREAGVTHGRRKVLSRRGTARSEEASPPAVFQIHARSRVVSVMDAS